MVLDIIFLYGFPNISFPIEVTQGTVITTTAISSITLRAMRLIVGKISMWRGIIYVYDQVPSA